jgi:hypothetical protein
MGKAAIMARCTEVALPSGCVDKTSCEEITQQRKKPKIVIIIIKQARHV